ncbi:hypothetical protein [Mycoplasma sp. Ms02]|nr:hypothetical protein [Mycoplasma sp. Ms02]QZE12227.1 hypothetical protein K4L35_02690 [Mycoplasma sp. Ms02]
MYWYYIKNFIKKDLVKILKSILITCSVLAFITFLIMVVTGIVSLPTIL